MIDETFETARPVSARRELPHSVDSEEGLISCCLMDGGDTVSKCILAGITPLSFFGSANATMFDALAELYREQKPIGIMALMETLRIKKRLDEVGGVSELARIGHLQPTTMYAQFFIGKVSELYRVREIIAACAQTLEESYAYTGEIEDFTDKISDRMNRAIGGVSDHAEATIQAVAAELHAEVTSPDGGQKKGIGEVSWGLVDVDKGCGRLAPGNLIVLAGPPSTGKSAVADQVAWGSAVVGNETLVFTYEMTKREKAIRIAQQVSRLNYDQLYTAPMDRKQAFDQAVKGIVDCPHLHVYERDVSVNRITARVRSFIDKGKKVGLIVVDFLQYLARLEAQIGRERTDEKIGRLTAALKALAREAECPVLLLSSLNREGYREGNRANVASLKASGEIESDGDVVVLLHWPAENPVSGAAQDPHDSTQSHFYVEFNQEKGRMRGVHQIGLLFDRHATRFENLSQRQP
jgi:replicative DNA helicase